MSKLVGKSRDGGNRRLQGYRGTRRALEEEGWDAIGWS